MLPINLDHDMEKTSIPNGIYSYKNLHVRIKPKSENMDCRYVTLISCFFFYGNWNVNLKWNIFVWVIVTSFTSLPFFIISEQCNKNFFPHEVQINKIWRKKAECPVLKALHCHPFTSWTFFYITCRVWNMCTIIHLNHFDHKIDWQIWIQHAKRHKTVKKLIDLLTE